MNISLLHRNMLTLKIYTMPFMPLVLFMADWCNHHKEKKYFPLPNAHPNAFVINASVRMQLCF